MLVRFKDIDSDFPMSRHAFALFGLLRDMLDTLDEDARLKFTDSNQPLHLGQCPHDPKHLETVIALSEIAAQAGPGDTPHDVRKQHEEICKYVNDRAIDAETVTDVIELANYYNNQTVLDGLACWIAHRMRNDPNYLYRLKKL